MSHLLRQQYLQERLQVLEDLTKTADCPIMVCSSCYTPQDPVGCLCDLRRWTLLSVVILQIRLDLTNMHNDTHGK